MTHVVRWLVAFGIREALVLVGPNADREHVRVRRWRRGVWSEAIGTVSVKRLRPVADDDPFVLAALAAAQSLCMACLHETAVCGCQTTMGGAA